MVERSGGSVPPLTIYRDQGLCIRFLYLSCQALLSSPLATFILCLKAGVSLLSSKCDHFFFFFAIELKVLRSFSASYHPRNILGEVASSTPLVLLDFHQMVGLSCGRPGDRASFVFPPRSHLASWGTSSLKFFQLKLLLNIYSSSSFPSPAGIDADPPTGTKI